MLNDVYNKKIIELARNIPNIGTLEDFDATASSHSPVCGSRITVYLKLQDGHISDYAHNVQACTLGKAAASLVAQQIIGKTPQDMVDLHRQMKNMLSENGDLPENTWHDFIIFVPIRTFKARHASFMLVFNAIHDAFNSISDNNGLE